MKPPNFPSLSESRPLPQFGHTRGSTPSARGGNRCGPSISSSASMTCATRGEIVFNIAGKEALQERGQHAPLVFRYQPFLVDADIAAILEHLQDRRVGGGPA